MATMLDCKTVQPRLSEYVDGAVDGDQAWSIKLHLATCAVCSRVEEELRGTASLLQSLAPMEPSASFEAKLAQRLADQVLQPRRPSLRDRIRDWWYDAPYARPAVTSTVALAALIPAVFVMVNHSQTSSPGTATNTVATTVTASAAKGTTLEQVWAEHTSSDPFGDDSTLLLSSSPTPGEAGAVSGVTPAVYNPSSATSSDDPQSL